MLPGSFSRRRTSLQSGAVRAVDRVLGECVIGSLRDGDLDSRSTVWGEEASSRGGRAAEGGLSRRSGRRGSVPCQPLKSRMVTPPEPERAGDSVGDALRFSTRGPVRGESGVGVGLTMRGVSVRSVGAGVGRTMRGVSGRAIRPAADCPLSLILDRSTGTVAERSMGRATRCPDRVGVERATGADRSERVGAERVDAERSTRGDEWRDTPEGGAPCEAVRSG